MNKGTQRQGLCELGLSQKKQGVVSWNGDDGIKECLNKGIQRQGLFELGIECLAGDVEKGMLSYLIWAEGVVMVQWE